MDATQEAINTIEQEYEMQEIIDSYVYEEQE